MSVAIRRALYGKLAGDTTLTGMLATPPAGYSKSIFYEVAPEGAKFPYVIFNKQSGTPSYSLSANNFDNEVWTIKGIDKGATADTADAISSRLDALLTETTGTTLSSISGKTEVYFRRESDVDYAEVRDGETYRHSGAMFRLITT